MKVKIFPKKKSEVDKNHKINVGLWLDSRNKKLPGCPSTGGGN